MTIWDRVVTLPIPNPLKDLLVSRPIFLRFVSGTVTWPRDWYEPVPPTPQTILDVISVQANEWVQTPGMFAASKLVKVGQVTNVTVADGTCSFDYMIVGLPRNREFFIEANVKKQSAFHAPGNTGAHFNPTGDWVFTFTDNNASRSGVDFRGAYSQIN